MKSKNSRLDAIKIIISSKEVGSQEELLQELAKEGFRLTQATLSRDLKQLKVAKAASMNGNYVYVLPNNTMYKRMTEQHSASEMLMHNGFISIEFSANLAVIKTRPGYASSLAYDIDNRNFDEILEERMAVKHSHYLIADNMGIHDYYKEKYGKDSKFLAYGADIHDDYNVEHLKEYGLKPEEYYILVARLEPENNIVMAIEGYLHSKENGKRPLIVVGKTNTPHGKELVAKYGKEKNVKFVGGIYDFNKLNSIRHFSKAYFHGHSVGGTNPSLLEAMASECFILAHDNIFNRAVLKKNSLYYPNAEKVTEMLNDIESICTQHKKNFTDGNVEEIKNEYSWEHLVDQHEEYFKWLLAQKRVNR